MRREKAKIKRMNFAERSISSIWQMLIAKFCIIANHLLDKSSYNFDPTEKQFF